MSRLTPQRVTPQPRSPPGPHQAQAPTAGPPGARGGGTTWPGPRPHRVLSDPRSWRPCCVLAPRAAPRPAVPTGPPARCPHTR